MSDLEIACPEPDSQELGAEEVATVHEEVGKLPDRYRLAVVLCHFEGLTHAEAARRLGCASGTVGSLVTRARDMLRSRLARRGFSSGAVLLARALEPKLAKAVVPLTLERSTIQAALVFASNRTGAVGIASSAAVDLARGTLRTMSLTKLTGAVAVIFALSTLAIGVGDLSTAAPRAVDSPAAGQLAQPPDQHSERLTPTPTPASPQLPGAMGQPPPWLIKEAPFDITAYFAAPPTAENAAPRYLDALFEFGAEMAVCFPEGPERESRKQAAEKRTVQFYEIFSAMRKNPNAVSGARIDAMLEEFETGFRKLTWAQQRPRCVFQTAHGVTARVPHAMVARQVARVAVLKVRRERERGEVDAAIRDLARLLRLSRDLLPRGGMIIDLVSASIEGSASKEIILPLLTTPGLTIEHCDRLLALLADHESRSVDPYIEGLRAEYVYQRMTLHDLVFEQDRLRKEWNSLGNPAGPSIVAEIVEPTFFVMLGGNGQMPQPGVGQRVKSAVVQMMALKNIADLDARMARTTPEELSQQVDKLNEYYRSLQDFAGAPYLERIRRSATRPPSLSSIDLRTRVTRGLLPATSSFEEALARWKATMRVTQGLVAVRRWQLRHGGKRRRLSKLPSVNPAFRRSRPTPTTSGRSASPWLEASRPSIPSAKTVGTTEVRPKPSGHPMWVTFCCGFPDPETRGTKNPGLIAPGFIS